MAIDYGRKRCGIAVTDSLRLAANPLTTIDTPRLIEFVIDYLSREHVDGIIVGYPTRLNGQESDSMRYITPGINRLRKLVTVPIEFYDERFTSVLAHKAMLDSGIGRMRRRDKALVDAISASIILNDYLSSRQGKAAMSPTL